MDGRLGNNLNRVSVNLLTITTNCSKSNEN